MNHKFLLILMILIGIGFPLSHGIAQPFIETDPPCGDPDGIYMEFDAGLTDQVYELPISNIGDEPLSFAIDAVFDGDRVLNTKETIVGIDHGGRKGDVDHQSNGVVLRGEGGPDWYGYRWKDSDESNGPAFVWNDISQSGVEIDLGDDDNEGPFDLGFDFDFYGQIFNTVYVCSNGWLSFTSTSTDLSNSCIGEADGPENMIAAFWDDLDPGNSGSPAAVYYLAEESTFTVQFTEVPHYPNDGSNTFQIVLHQNGQIFLYYYEMVGDLTGATIGIEDNAQDGLEVVCDAEYMHDELAVRFQNFEPWLMIEPLAGEVPPGETMFVDVIFNPAPGVLAGVYTADLQINSNDPETPVCEIPVELNLLGNGSAYVDPEEFFEFGLAGDPMQRVLSICSEESSQRLIDWELTISDGDWLSADTTSGSGLEPGMCHDVHLTFDTNQEEGVYETIIIVEWNDGDISDVIEVPVMMEIVIPAIEVVETAYEMSIDLSDPPDGYEISDEILIYNNGSGPLIYGVEVEYEPEGDLSRFGQHTKPLSAAFHKPAKPTIKGVDMGGRKGEPSGASHLRGEGGPDWYGYTWIDSDEDGGPNYEWNDIREEGTMIPMSDDRNEGPYELGFNFEYYGQTFDSIYVCSNGWASFTSTSTDYSNTCIGEADGPENMLAPFWDDLHPRSGAAYYLADGNTFTIQWDNFGRFSGDGNYTFQIVLTSDNEIYYYYHSMSGTLNSATIGIEDNGQDGLEVICNADYIHNELAIRIATEPEMDWVRISPAIATVWPDDSPLVGIITFDAQSEDGGSVLLGGTYYAVAHFLSNDPNNPDFPVDCTFHLEGEGLCVPQVEPEAFDLELLENEVHEDTLIIGNGRAGMQLLDYVLFVSPEVAWLTLSQSEGSGLEPGESDEIIVTTTAPGECDTYTTTIYAEFPCDDSVVEIPVTLDVSDPELFYEPTAINESVEEGSITEVTLTLVNDGCGDLPLEVVLSSETNQANTFAKALIKGIDVETPKGEESGKSHGAVLHGSGGPDYFGYQWIDSDENNGPEFVWNDIQETGTELVMWDDRNVGPFALGFDFDYYGQIFDSVYVCSNGWLSFTNTSTDYSNSCIGEADGPENMIAPFWDDLFPPAGGSVHYLAVDDQFIVQFTEIEHLGTGGPYTFQVVLHANGTINFYYQTMNDPLNSATIGIEDQAQDGLEVVCNGDYIHDELAVKISTNNWLSVEPEQATLMSGEEAEITVILDANETDGVGTYTGLIYLAHNDADQETPLEIPVTLIVGEGGGDLYTISGHVGYWHEDIDMAQTEVNLQGDMEHSVMTGENGMYEMVDIPVGDYTTDAYREGYLDVDQPHSSISAFDAARIAQYAANLYSFNEYQLIAGDVTEDGAVTTFDAARILQYAGHLEQPSYTGEWRFDPIEYAYQPLTMNMLDQDFVAILLGEVTGNWTPDQIAVFQKPATSTIAAIPVTMESVSATAGEEVVVPVRISDATAFDIIAMQGLLEYDPNVLEFVEYRTAGTLSEGFILASSSNLAGYRLTPLQGEGVLVNLVFKTIGVEGESSSVVLNHFMLNESLLPSVVGEVKIQPKAAVPETFSLLPNYPNPFNPVTHIGFALPQERDVTLKIYDTTGQLVRVLIDETYQAGYHTVSWDGTDDQGYSVSSGVYIYVLEAGDFIQSRKMMLLK